jgi:N utilization substance protein A
VHKSAKGPQLILSRTHKNLLKRLFELEVPEIYKGTVEIKSIAREPGYRSKVAVSARQEGVDPVGSCVGLRGIRIQNIVNELGGERIDVVQWDANPARFVANALSPAQVSGVSVSQEDNTASVVVPDRQLSLAIGKEGQNARLAAKLTGWRIDIKSLSEAAGEAYRRLREDEAFAEVAQANADMLNTAEGVTAKKAEGKPITPEEYQLLAKVVDLVEKKVARERAQERAAKVERVAAIRAAIPVGARTMTLADVPLSERVQRLLVEAEFKTVGEVMEQLALDENRILALEGFTTKELDELKKVFGELTFAEPEPEPEPMPEPAAAPELEAIASVAEVVEVVAPEAVAAPAPEAVSAEAPVAEAVAPAVEEEGEEGTEDFEEKDEEDLDESGDKKKAKKKGKKKGTVEITYDEELGVYVKRKQRKAGRTRDEFEVESGT